MIIFARKKYPNLFRSLSYGAINVIGFYTGFEPVAVHNPTGHCVPTG